MLLLPKDYEMTDATSLSRSWSHVGKGIWRMCTTFAWWDVSWWIAVLFSVGSAIFVICGFFYWLPLAAPSTEFRGEGLAGGLTAFIGATLFTIGGVLLIVEASNENQTDCFGWALKHTFSHSDSYTEAGSPHKDDSAFQLVKEECNHHHQQGLHKVESVHLQHPSAGRKWEWVPTWHELTTHYFHETGFLASFILAIGAVIFYVSGIMAIPQIYNNVSQGALYGTYWFAYLFGGVLFVISSVLYILEVQKNWYTPAPRLIGWWIGVWNTIGSVGWVVSAAFGYCSASWCEYQSDLSLIWASVAFLIGSLLLWYESLDKYVVERATS